MCARERKTKWHTDWQEAFPIYAREVSFQQFDGSLRIADVALGNLVLEFQHSGISYEEIANRTIFHRAAGRDVWWVFDRRGKDISELIPKEKGVADTGRYLGSYSISKHIISAICPSDLDERADRMLVGIPGNDGFGKILILDYGNYCVMLGGFDRRCCERQYAAFGYIVDHEFVVQLALHYDEIIAEVGDDDNWLMSFMEQYCSNAISIVLNTCLKNVLIPNQDEFYKQLQIYNSIHSVSRIVIADAFLRK